MQIFTHFVNLNLNMSLKRPVQFKFNKDTIDTHSTIADRQHKVILTFLLSAVLALLTLSHNMCHCCSNKLLIQAICEKTALEVLNTHVCIVKTIHWYRSQLVNHNQ